jgi:rhomboid protease GluP
LLKRPSLGLEGYDSTPTEKDYTVNCKPFFDNLGLNGTRWQWRLMRWEKNFAALRRGEGLSGDGLSPARLILIVNLIWFSLMVVKGVTAGLGLQPLMSPPLGLLHYFGAQRWIPEVLHYGQWWRCLTYAYTHGGLMHIGFNMFVLYQVGPMIEREIGARRFIVLYTLTALTATLLGLLWHPYTPVVGASGSIFGLIGFAVAYFHRMGQAGVGMRNFMFRWAAFSFVFGLLVGADNAGHLGGALGGAVFGMILPIGIRGRKASSSFFSVAALLCVIATIGCLAMQVLTWFLV